jgi:hypothetical protein
MTVIKETTAALPTPAPSDEVKRKPRNTEVTPDIANFPDRGTKVAASKERDQVVVLAPPSGNSNKIFSRASGEGSDIQRGSNADDDGSVTERNGPSVDTTDDEDDFLSDEAIEGRFAIEIANEPDGENGARDGWQWRYDEHNNKIWYRVPGDKPNEDKNARKITSITEQKVDMSTRFPLTFHPPPNSTVRPPRGYWLVDEQGNHIWYRYERPGRYIRDPIVTISPQLNVPKVDDRLTWSGIGDVYWLIDESGRKVWYKLSRRGDGRGELIGGLAAGKHDNDNDTFILGSSKEDDAPHVYLSSGPGGRGGYWAIDEHGHYVWHHYVGPNKFEKDESTATDIMSVPPGFQHQMSSKSPTTSSAATSVDDCKEWYGNSYCIDSF